MQSVSSLLGDEVVFSVASAGPRDEVPMVMARVQAGKRAALTSALDGLFADAGESSPPVFGVRRADGGLRLAVAPDVGRSATSGRAQARRSPQPSASATGAAPAG